jgi:hypothetical protein
MVKASPASPFVMVKTQLILEFLEIALDAPANLGETYQVFKRNIRGNRG